MNEPLRASEGMIFTNGETYGKIIYLATGDDPANWWEVTQEEYERTLRSNEPADIYAEALETLGVDLNMEDTGDE